MSSNAMRVDFSEVEDVQSFVSVPEGEYPCRVVEVREGLTRDGGERWAFRLEVAEGDYAGRTAAWDSISWTERALPRAKYVLSKLGFDVSGTLELRSSDLVGCEVLATLQAEERQDRATGHRVERMRVPYHGYAS
jgi:hypothetical protein